MSESGPSIDPRLLARCHENLIYSYQAFVPPEDPSAFEQRPGLTLVATGSHDSLGNPAFATAPLGDPEGVVRRVRAFFQTRGLPWCLISFPEATEGLRPGARVAGLYDEGDFPGMLLHPLRPLSRPLPVGVRVSRVAGTPELGAWEETFAASYGTPPLPPDERSLHLDGIVQFLGYLDDRPAATAMLVAHQGIAGIAAVGTVPAARRRGVADAAVRRAIDEGLSRGCDASFLWATPRGYPVYERIGFRRIFDYRIWTEPGAPLPTDIRPPPSA